MATLSVQNFTTLVSNMAAAAQASAASLLNLTTGSVLRAILEANASAALWLQWLILQVLSMTRLSTSTGADVDSFVGDYGLARLPAVASSGAVTFSRYSTTIAALVPVGATVKTADGARIFQVVADTLNAAWNGSTGFVIPSATASVTCNVVDVTTDANGALSIGLAGNVQAGAISLLASAIAGVDTVTNASPFVNGIDAESDASLAARFSDYIQTRSRGTVDAVIYAVEALGQNISCTVQENVSPLGAYWPGNFVVTVDDGTGAPSGSLLTQSSIAISGYRPVGTTWSVQAPTVTTATVTMTITCDPVAAKTPILLASVQAALLTYINTIPDGSRLPYTRLAMVAYMVDATIVDVTNVTLNAGTADIVPGPGGAVKATTGSVTVA